MNLPGPNSVHSNLSGVNLPASRSQAKTDIRRKKISASQTADLNIENLAHIDENHDLAYIAKDVVFKARLVGSVLIKHLDDHLMHDASQQFDEIYSDIERAAARENLETRIEENRQLSLHQRISNISFRYLFRLKNAITVIARTGELSSALNEADRICRAVDEGVNLATIEIGKFGILNDEVNDSYKQAKRTMQTSIIDTASAILAEDLTRTNSEVNTASLLEIKKQYHLMNENFTSRLHAAYEAGIQRPEKYSDIDKINKGKDSGDILVVPMTPITGQGVELYLVNENQLQNAQDPLFNTDSIIKYLRIQPNRYLKLGVGINGSLDQREADALELLFQHITNLSDSYYSDRICHGYKMFDDYSCEELCSYLLDHQRKVFKKNIDTYQFVSNSVSISGYDFGEANLNSLERFANELRTLMQISKQFGIKRSERFISDVLGIIIGFDNRQKFDFFRSDKHYNEIIDDLVSGILKIER